MLLTYLSLARVSPVCLCTGVGSDAVPDYNRGGDDEGQADNDRLKADHLTRTTGASASSRCIHSPFDNSPNSRPRSRTGAPSETTRAGAEGWAVWEHQALKALNEGEVPPHGFHARRHH